MTLLAGMAMAALSGCVSVEPHAPGHRPAASAGPTGGQTAPQIVQGPAREALEAAMPDPPAPESAVERHGQADGRSPALPRPAAQGRPEHVPEQLRHHLPGGHSELPRLPASRSDICRIGAAWGGWSSDSTQAKVCRNTYAR